jgi:threonylcarbamoyladenosine tRNA methylthiotransferase MtaB
MEEFHELTGREVREIVITGTHVGLYASEGKTLENLFETMANTRGNFRIHLSSIEPNEVSSKLIEIIAGHPKLCRHLHISFQSFSNTILQTMKRRYNFNFIQSLVKKISCVNQDIRIGTDIIVAFPGETDLLFDETLKRLEELPIHYGHVFRFSKRPGTAAALMNYQIERKVAENRSLALRELFEKKHRGFVETQKDKTHQVLIEEDVLKQGLTQNYLRVKVESEAPLLQNQFYPVKIIGQSQNEIIAQLCEK